MYSLIKRTLYVLFSKYSFGKMYFFLFYNGNGYFSNIETRYIHDTNPTWCLFSSFGLMSCVVPMLQYSWLDSLYFFSSLSEKLSKGCFLENGILEYNIVVTLYLMILWNYSLELPFPGFHKKAIGKICGLTKRKLISTIMLLRSALSIEAPAYMAFYCDFIHWGSLSFLSVLHPPLISQLSWARW